MSKFRDIIALANRLGLEKPPSSASDEEQIQHIAEQLGLDYDGTADSENEILNTLYDMEEESKNPFYNGYNPEYIETLGEDEVIEDGENKPDDNAESEQQQKKDSSAEESESSDGEYDKKDEKSDKTGDGKADDEKGPNDNGYDQSRIEDVNNSGSGNEASNNGIGDNPENGSDTSGSPNNNKQGNSSADNGESKPTNPSGSDSKPGEKNPNNDVNKNGSRPDTGTGNGYNSSKVQKANNSNSQTGQSGTVGNRNYQHQQRMQRGKKSEKVEEAVTKGKKVEKKAGGIAKKKRELEAARKQRKAARKVRQKQRLKKIQEQLIKLMGFLAKHPYLIIVIILIILFIIIIIAIISDEDVTGGGSGNGARNCTYELSGIVSSGETTLSGAKVELINCDGSASDYTVLANIDFEKYVLGVALAEIGPDAPDEAIKAQIIAARNFALTRNSGMCPGNQDDCFYGYNPNTGKIRMRACEADQVYWDYNKPIYREDRGAISLYSPEIENGTVWKQSLDDTRKEEIEKIAESVKGKVLLDAEGNVLKVGYDSTVSDKFSNGAANGNSYQKILSDIYGTENIESSRCAAVGNIDYGDYTLSSDSHEILHKPLEDFLNDNGSSIEDFNNLIASNVEDAGFGTRAGVVAAAVTLIGELGDNYGVKVPYYWGGGHYDGVVVGALGYWGNDPMCTTYANSQVYDYCGLDCSGFVPWAIKNGGFNIGQRLASDFYKLEGAEKVTLRSNEAVLEPGDLLESEEHVVLVVAIDEEAGQYVCAEASGNAQGVLFTRRSYKQSGYWGVKMDGYYNDSVHIRSE